MTNVWQGKRILITRPPDKAKAFADKIAALGAEPVTLPTIAIEPPANLAALDAAVNKITSYDFIAITSANTITALWGRFEVLGGGVPVLPPVAVVGKATAQVLAEHGCQPVLMPEEHTAEALASLMVGRLDLKGMKILLPQGDIARPTLEQSLREAGALVDVVIAYRTVRPLIDPALLAKPLDVVTFTSPSTVYNFCGLFDDPAAVIGHACIACIGPVTAEAVQEMGLPAPVIAEPHTVEGLIAVLSDWLEK